MAITLVAKADHHITGAGPLVLPSLSWQAGDVIAVSTSHIIGAPETITPTVAGLSFILAGQGGPDGTGWWAGRVGAVHYAVATSPGSGAISVAATTAGSGVAGYPWIDSAYVLRGVDTANPLRGTIYKSDGWNTENGLLTMATEPGDMVIGNYAFNNTNTAAAPTGGQTVDRSANDGSAWGLTYHQLADGASVASTWDRGEVEAQWRHVAAVFRAAQMGPAPTLTITSGPTIVDHADGQKVTLAFDVNFQGDATGSVSATVVTEPAGTVLGPWSVTINQARTAGTFERPIADIGAGTWRIKPTVSANGQSATATSSTFDVDEITGEVDMPEPPTAVAPAFTTAATLPAGTAGVNYAQQLAGTGSGSLAYALGSNPPAGWAVSSSGLLTRTSPAAGTFEIPVVLTGDTAPPATRTFSVTIAAAAVSPSFTTAPTLPGITAGTAMAVQLATAGDTPQTFTILSGAPAGLVVGSSTGVLTWPNPQPGQYDAIVVQASNAAGSATRTFSLAVAAAPVVQVPALAVTLQASEDEDSAEGFIRAYHPGTQVSSNVGGSMIEVYKGDTSRVFMFELRTPQGAPVLGASPSVILSKAGAVFATGAGQVIDAGGGRYGYWPLPADVDTEGLLVVVAKAAGAIDGIVQATVVQRYGRR